MSGKILIFTATYNERDNIRDFCAQVLTPDSTHDLLVVDDNSPDGTGAILDMIAAESPRVHVIHRGAKLGLGTAHELGMLYAVREGYDVLITMDADFSHPPSEIPRLLAALEENDFVIAARYMAGGRCDYRGYRLIVSQGATFLARILLRIPLHEFTSSFRAFRVDLLRHFDFTRIRSRGYSFFLETVYRTFHSGARIGEIPLHFADRTAGESKIPKLEILNGMWRLMYLSLAQYLKPHQPSAGSGGSECCYFCGSPYVCEQFEKPEQGVREHHPLVTCLQCGLSFRSGSADHSKAEPMQREKRCVPPNLSLALASCGPLPEKGTLLAVGPLPQSLSLPSQFAEWKVERAEHVNEFSPQSMQECGYDIAAVWAELEEVEDPLGELRRLAQMLPQNGILVVCASDVDTRSGSIRLRRPDLWPHKRFFFRGNTFRMLCTAAGFTVEAERRNRDRAPLREVVRVMAEVAPKPLGRALHAARFLVPRRLVLPLPLTTSKVYVCRRKPH